MAKALERAGIRYEQNFTIRTSEAMSGFYLVDFYIPRLKLLVEVDGGVHRSLRHEWRDRLRTEAIERTRPDLKLVRFWNSVVLADPDQVVADLADLVAT